MGQVRLTGSLTVPPDRLDALLPALADHINLTRAEPGCLHFEVHQDSGDATCFHVAETFIDRAAFEHHQQRASSSPWAEASAGLVRNYVIAERDP